MTWYKLGQALLEAAGAFSPAEMMLLGFDGPCWGVPGCHGHPNAKNIWKWYDTNAEIRLFHTVTRSLYSIHILFMFSLRVWAWDPDPGPRSHTCLIFLLICCSCLSFFIFLYIPSQGGPVHTVVFERPRVWVGTGIGPGWGWGSRFPGIKGPAVTLSDTKRCWFRRCCP